MFSPRAFYVLLALAVGYFAANGQSWQSLNGPTRAHEVVDIAIGKDANVQRIFAVDVDTVKRSTDGGRTWSATGASSFTAPLVVACRVADPSVAIAGKLSSSNAIYQTRDGGSSWNNVSPNPTYDILPQKIAISPADTSLAFLGTERTPGDAQSTLWRSPDGGVSWTEVGFFKNDANTFVNDILPHPTNSSYVYVAGSTTDVVYDAYPYEEMEAPYTKGFWRSSDAGVNWEFAGNIDPQDNNLSALAISVYGNTGIFAASYRGTSSAARIYQSTNNGTSWVQSGQDLTGATQVRSIKVHPTNAQMILVATNAGLFMSTNRGGSWSTNNTNVPDVAKNVYAVAFDLRSADTAYIATGASVYKGVYTSGAWTWTASVTGSNTLNTTAVSVRHDTAFAVSSGWTGISKYSGGAWNLISSVKKFAGYAVSTNRSNGSRVYVGGKVGNNGSVYQTTNAGSSWSVGTSTVSSTVFTCVLADQKANSNRVWAGIGGTGVPTNNIRISENGTSWGSDHTYYSGTEVNALATNTSSGSSYSTHVYAGLDSYGAEKSTDGGDNWSALGPNTYEITSVALNSSTAALADTVYFGSPDTVWKSTNGGTSITGLSTSSFSGAKKILVHPTYPSSPDYLWVIPANGQSIYKTENGGIHWSEVSTSGLTKPLNDLQRDPFDTLHIYVATSSGVYKINPAPAVPTGILAGDDNNKHPKIYWNANIEPDLAGYKVYRSECSMLQFTLLASVPKTQTDYTDTTRTIATGGDGVLRYQVKAFDTDSSLSSAIGGADYVCETRDQKASPSPESELPEVFALHPNHPNPFNPTTEIHFDLPEPATVSLIIYDLLGRKAAELANGNYEAGYHSVKWNAADLASGVYLARFTVVDDIGRVVYTKTNKVMLMK
jgi:photosystem II stability/assembly factor-like uncharacterized protein